MTSMDVRFVGSIPAIYDRDLVPLIFQGYAEDVAKRVAKAKPTRVLEVAAGTGVVTRQLARALPEAVALVATDLNPAMLEAAEQAGTARPVSFQQADALALPFEDASFDAIVCQFGAMFFPDKVAGYREARRVLAPGGRFWLSVWDELSHNEVFLVVQRVVVEMFPDDPPLFFERKPYGYHDEARITSELTAGGFQKIEIERLRIGSRAESAESAARGCCEGTPLRGELEARAPGKLSEITAAAARALEARFGSGSFAHDIQALVVTAS